MIRVARHAAQLIAFGLALAITLTGSEALADNGKAELTVYEIRASNDKGDSDPELSKGRLANKLRKGPFRSWTKFEKLAKHEKTVAQLKAQMVGLKPGGKLSVLYRSRIQSKGKKDRLRLSITLDKKNGKRHLDTTIELDAGDFFLVGGQNLPDGATYILAISLK
jgi:hypothetical protein